MFNALMRKFYKLVVNHSKFIIFLFLVMFAICIVCSRFVSVNYDMKDYLPEDSPSTVSLDLMRQEFDGDIPNARVMIKNVTIPEALAYKEQLENCVGVTDVMWLDDSVDIREPLDMFDTDTVETYYKNQNALYVVAIGEDEKIQAVDAIRQVIGDENVMSGEAVSTAIATTSTVNEVAMIAVFSVLLVLLILTATTTSWLEPIAVLIGLGVAIVINKGSNLIFGEISFVTNAAGSILQLAVSLDYSVFLLHSYEDCRKDFDNPREAMVEALCKSTTSVLSSGLTTVIGFMALIFMRFGIGSDLGLALSKGVLISLITVFVFSPVVILAMNKYLDKFRHRSFMPSFNGFAKVVYRLMIPMVLVFAVMVVPAYLASNSNNFYYGSSHIFGEGTRLYSDVNAIREAFGDSDTYVLMVPQGDTAREEALSDTLHELSAVKNIVSYVDTVGAEIPPDYLSEDTLAKLISDNYSRMVISVEAEYEGQETFALVEEIRSIANDYYPNQYYLAGEGVSTYDLMTTTTADTVKVNLIAIVAVFVVLLFSFKSLTLPILLVLSIETAIWINLAIPYFRGSTVFYISYLIISSIQLGATVDYAILFTDRYLGFRKNYNKKSAVQKTIANVFVSVMTSGSALIIVGFLLGYVSSHGILSQLGLFLGKGALLSLTIVLFVLPGLLYIFDGLIRHTTLGIKWHKAK